MVAMKTTVKVSHVPISKDGMGGVQESTLPRMFGFHFN